MKKIYTLLIAILFIGSFSNLKAQREEILYDGGTLGTDFGSITYTHTPGEDSPGSTTVGAVEITGAGWNSGDFWDDVDNFMFQNIDLVNGTFTFDYKTTTPTTISSISFHDYDGAAMTTFLTGASNMVLTADDQWHTLIVPFNTDWEAGTVGAGLAYELTDAVNPRIILQFNGNGGAFFLDNFVYNAAPHVAATGVTLDQSTLDLALSETATLVRTVTPANASNRNVIWSSSNSNIASVSGGVVTAKTVGTCDITVTTNDGGFTDVCVVTISAVSVTGVTLNKTAITLEIGATDTLVPTIEPANASDTTFLPWVSNNSGVASVSGGVVTAISSGIAEITITTADGFLTATCTVTVPSPSASITNNKASDVSIYPVPAKSVITISNISNFNSIEIVDLTGHIVLRTNNEDAVKDINIESLSPGSYIFYLKGVNEIYKKTIIIE